MSSATHWMPNPPAHAEVSRPSPTSTSAEQQLWAENAQFINRADRHVGVRSDHRLSIRSGGMSTCGSDLGLVASGLNILGGSLRGAVVDDNDDVLVAPRAFVR